MATIDLAESLTREHREIDAGIEAFLSALDEGRMEAEPLHDAFAALRRHIYLEEELLFPPIRRAALMMPVLVMTKEHGELWRLMDAIDDLLTNAEPDRTTILSSCRELLDGLDGHNMKEEPIIYPHTATDLAPEEEATLADFIATGALPDGWVCAAAR